MYRIKDLLDRLHELFQQGCEYAEIQTDNASLSIQGINESTEHTCLTLPSCQYGDGSEEENDNDNCYELQFSYDEIATIASALANMPSIYEKAIDDESYDPREREAFRIMLGKMQDLKHKMEDAFR